MLREGWTFDEWGLPKPPPPPPKSSIEGALLSAHRVCVQAGLPHMFFGGAELTVFGCPRPTRDVDVEVTVPTEQLGGIPKIVSAFEDDEEFVISGAWTDLSIHTVWNGEIKVTVWMRGPLRMPKNPLFIPMGKVIDTKGRRQMVPFFKPKHLLVEKIRCCGERKRDADAEDANWIFDHLRAPGTRITHPGLDFKEIKKMLTVEEIAAARQNHPVTLRAALDAIASF